MAQKRRTERPFLAVDIPDEGLSAPAELYQMIWGKF